MEEDQPERPKARNYGMFLKAHRSSYCVFGHIQISIYIYMYNYIYWDVVKDIALLLVFCCIVAFISHFLFLFHYHGLVVLIYIFGFYYYYYCIVIASNMIRGYDLLFVPSCPI